VEQSKGGKLTAHSIYKVTSKQNFKARHFTTTEKTTPSLCCSGVCNTFPDALVKWGRRRNVGNKVAQNFIINAFK